MTEAFCPGHITLFFSPRRTGDILRSGSVGAGIKTALGANVAVEERRDSRISVSLDGADSDAPVTAAAVAALAPGRGFDISIECGLPVSQGFGMSAAGTIAAGTCVCDIVGRDPYEAFPAAHIAEIENGGGLGDVAAIMCQGHQPTRESAGLPPHGKVTDSGLSFDLTIAVVGPPISTARVLSDPLTEARIKGSGDRCLRSYVNNRTESSLFALAREFSRAAGLESAAVTEALSLLPGRSAMCMLGYSIITTASAEEVRALLPKAEIYGSASFGGSVIRKG
ncbi:MAG: pantothenate kinase [Candidatus Methanomethylophilaceae archaeon]|nr:pantothenate kinase [Candidatus Methanomethylophilaceae archaeon]